MALDVDLTLEDNGALIERIRSAAECISFDETHPANQQLALGIIHICDILSRRDFNPAVAEQNRLMALAEQRNNHTTNNEKQSGGFESN